MASRPRKRFSQHWLQSDKALNQIIQAAELSEPERVLEIDLGTSILNRILLPLVKSIVAVEINQDLGKFLAKKCQLTLC